MNDLTNDERMVWLAGFAAAASGRNRDPLYWADQAVNEYRKVPPEKRPEAADVPELKAKIARLERHVDGAEWIIASKVARYADLEKAAAKLKPLVNAYGFTQASGRWQTIHAACLEIVSALDSLPGEATTKAAKCDDPGCEWSGTTADLSPAGALGMSVEEMRERYPHCDSCNSSGVTGPELSTCQTCRGSGIDPRPLCVRCGERWTPAEGEDATRLPCTSCMPGAPARARISELEAANAKLTRDLQEAHRLTDVLNGYLVSARRERDEARAAMALAQRGKAAEGTFADKRGTFADKQGTFAAVGSAVEHERLRRKCSAQRRELSRLNAKLRAQVAALRERYVDGRLTTERAAELKHDADKARRRALEAETRLAALRDALEQAQSAGGEGKSDG